MIRLASSHLSLSLSILALLFVPVSAQLTARDAPTGTWRIDPGRSMVQFTVTKVGFTDVTGRFTDFGGSVRYDSVRPENSAVNWTVRVASVETDAANRDSTLQAPEYFDARRHPELRFRSTRVTALADGALAVDGEITIKGITRPQRIVARRVHGGFETTFELDRFDFGIVGWMVMRRLIGRMVRIHLVAIADEEDR